MKNALWYLLFSILASHAHIGRASEESSLSSIALAPLRAIQDIPDFVVKADPLKHPSAYLLLAGITGPLIVCDQSIIDESQRFAHRIGLLSKNENGRETTVVTKSRIFGIDANLHLPRTPNTLMYYIGDGITSVAIASGLIGYGLWNNDSKALATTSQMVEAISLTGFFIVTGKMSTGRESPFRASEDGGKWRGFVGFKNYLSDVSKHDAYPSGHIATAMATVRVLTENYFEKKWIPKVGYVGMGLLMFAMLNNGVHWASDYPLGIAVGYHAATVVLDRHKVLEKNHSSTSPSYFDGVDIFAHNGQVMLQKVWWL